MVLTSLNALWVAFGTGKNFPLIPAHEIYTAIGCTKSLALPMFHACLYWLRYGFFFFIQGEKDGMGDMDIFLEITDTFSALMQQPQHSDVDAC